MGLLFAFTLLSFITTFRLLIVSLDFSLTSSISSILFSSTLIANKALKTAPLGEDALGFDFAELTDFQTYFRLGVIFTDSDLDLITFTDSDVTETFILWF